MNGAIRSTRHSSTIYITVLLIIFCWLVISCGDSPAQLTNIEILSTADAIRAQTQTPTASYSFVLDTDKATEAAIAYGEIALTDQAISNLQAEALAERDESRLKEYHESSEINVLLWSEAASHVGESTSVCGPVAGTRYASATKGAPTFINLGVDYPNTKRFTIMIWGRDRNNFTSPPEEYYLGKSLCVTGKITLYKGISQIEVSKPVQIELDN